MVVGAVHFQPPAQPAEPGEGRGADRVDDGVRVGDPVCGQDVLGLLRLAERGQSGVALSDVFERVVVGHDQHLIEVALRGAPVRRNRLRERAATPVVEVGGRLVEQKQADGGDLRAAAARSDRWF